MSFHYLQEQVVVSSDHILWDGKQFVPSKSKTILGGYCLPDKKTDCCHSSPSGMMLPLLTASHGKAGLTSSRVDSLVKTSPVQGKAQGSRGNGQGYGVKWQESLAKYDLDSSSWKTHQCLFEEDLQWSSVILPKWGMLANGVLSERTTPVALTNGIGSGYWLTPCVVQIEPTPGRREKRKAFRESIGRKDVAGCLAEQVATPKLWPTLSRRDYKGANSKPYSERGGGKKGEQLPNAVVHGGTLTRQTFPTPTVEDHKVGHAHTWEKWINQKQTSGFRLRDKAAHMMSKPAKNGQLNPDWVEWMMGWPLFWTSLDPMCYHVFNQWREKHGIKQWAQSSTEEVQNKELRNVWWDNDPAETSQGWECDQQCTRKHNCPLSNMPYEGAHAERNMGEGESEAGHMQDMRGSLPAEAKQKQQAMREAIMSERTRPVIGRVAVAIPDRCSRLKAIGNGQAPMVLKLAVDILCNEKP